MLTHRVIPCLLLKGQGLVKTIQFGDPRYVGDPVNAVRIFNKKEVDELILLDIQATVNGTVPRVEFISKIAGECFMPICYGGGIRDVNQAREILNKGVEKIAVNTHAVENPGFVKDLSAAFGSQSIIVSIDAKKKKDGRYEVFIGGGKVSTGFDVTDHARSMVKMGCGEILLNSIDMDGTQMGYDIELIKRVSREVSVPVIACGGAGKLAHFVEAINSGGASAVSAGSLFVFHGKHRAVLISYPPINELEGLLQ